MDFWFLADQSSSLWQEKRARPRRPHPRAKSERNTEIVRQYYQDGLTMRKIAQAYDISQARVKSIIDEARLK